MRNMTHPEKPCVLEQNNAKTEVAALMSVAVAVAEEDEKALAVAANNQGRFPIQKSPLTVTLVTVTPCL